MSRVAVKSAASVLGTGSRVLSYLLGWLVIALAIGVCATDNDVGGVAGWADKVFDPVFLILLSGLVFLATFSLIKVTGAARGIRAWFETGMQASSGIATLALTYTLLGISLGIGSLAERTLTPETVQDVIHDLTANFSTAFMTTVVGLPVSAVLRALHTVIYSRRMESGAPAGMT